MLARTWRVDATDNFAATRDFRRRYVSSTTYAVDLFLHEDGTMCITSKEIKGLVMELHSFESLLEELPAICSILLESNHGLRKEDLSDVTINVCVTREKSPENADWNGLSLNFLDYSESLAARA